MAKAMEITEQSHRVGDLVYHMLLSHKDRDDTYTEWRKTWNAKEQYREPLFEGGADLQIPIIKWMCSSIIERLVMSQFGLNTPPIRIAPIDLKDTDLANAITTHVSWWWNYTKKRNVVEMAVTDAVVMGSGVVKISVEKKDFTEVVTEYIPIENFYTYPLLGTDFEDAVTAVAYRFYTTKYELANMGIDPEVVEQLSTTPMLTSFDILDDDRAIFSTSSHTKSDVVELFEVYYRNDEGKWSVALYHRPSGVVIMEWEHKTKRLPFFLLRFTPYGYGVGLAGLLEPFEEEISILHNQRVDNNTLINMPIFLVNSSSPAMRDKEQWYSGKKIPVDTPQDIIPLQVAERVTPLQDEQMLFSYAKLVSGISEIMSGVIPQGERTAYEVEVALSEGSIKMRKYIMSVIDWLIEQVKYEILLHRKWGDDKVAVRIVGYNPYDMIDEQDIVFRFNYMGNTTINNRESERNKWLLLRNLLSQEPSVVSDPVRWWELLRQVLVAFDVADYRTIIGDKPPEAVPTPPMMSPVSPLQGGTANQILPVGGE